LQDHEAVTRPRHHLSGRELLLIFVFWTSLATLSAVNRLVDPRDFGGMRAVSPAGPIALTFMESWLWAAFTPLIFRLSSRLGIERSRWFVRIPILIIIGIAGSVAIYSILGYAREEWFDVPRRGFSTFAPLREIGRFRFANQLLVYFAVVAAGYAREYFLRDQERQREAVTLQAQLAEARLDALRMQINPHFLFNTLHAIAALVERDPPGVRKMIARLSDLLRRTIDTRAAAEVPLRDELSFLRGYIEIMEIRFQGKLRVTTEVDPAALDALVPNLVLQPVVENALEHGAGRVSDGRVAITAAKRGDRLLLTVRDNGPGPDGTGRQSGGVGLANTRARLAQLYGDAASLTLRAADGGGAVAEIALPFREG
jgi:signal transduction histidine kinase